MNKSAKRAIAAVLASLSLASFAGCDIIKDVEEVTEDKTPIVEAQIPVTKQEIVDYYNTVTNYLRNDSNFNSNAPSVDIGEKIDIDDIKITAPESDETPDELKPLATSAKQIKKTILEKLNSSLGSEAGKESIEYGKGGIKDCLSPKGADKSALTIDDVVEAKCETENGVYNIDIYIESSVDSVKKVFDLPDKASVLSEIAKADNYTVIKDYTVAYIDRDDRAQYNAENPDAVPECKIHMEVDADTNKVTSIEFVRCEIVNAPALGTGSFENFGRFNIAFRLKDTKSYTLIWTAPVTE